MKITGVVLFILGLWNWTAALIKHYRISTPMAWSDAQEYCKHYYEDLSTIHSLSELVLLSESLVASSWIGLYRDDDEDESKWTWSGGEDTDFLYWASDEPSSMSGFDCVFAQKNKKWSTASCSAQLTFFCMKTLPDLILIQQKKTWMQALDYCRAYYTDLSSLQLEEENALAVNVSQTAQTTLVWIGLGFLAGDWFWVNGHYLSYQAWGEEQQFQCPAQNIRCGALEKNSNVWIPMNCEEELNFICV